MANFDESAADLERKLDYHVGLGSRVSQRVDSAIMADDPQEAARYGLQAVRLLRIGGRAATSAKADVANMKTIYKREVDDHNNTKTNFTIAGIAAGIFAFASVALGIGYATVGSDKKEPAPIVRSVEETVKPATKELYTVERYADRIEFVISKESLGRSFDARFSFSPDLEDSVKDYLGKAEVYAAKKGKIGARTYFFPSELEAEMKELYSKDAKSTYGAENKLVKQDIERATKKFEGE
jgi:hypothetical protein